MSFTDKLLKGVIATAFIATPILGCSSHTTNYSNNPNAQRSPRVGGGSGWWFMNSTRGGTASQPVGRAGNTTSGARSGGFGGFFGGGEGFGG
jgi:hypothetical protein